MKRCLIYAFVVMSLMISGREARADIEALQGVLTVVGDLVASIKEEVVRAKGLITKGKELATQCKKMAKDVQNTVDQAKRVVKTAEEKVQEIKNTVDAIRSAAESKDVKGLKSSLESIEFAGLNKVLGGKETDEERAEAVLDSMVRKRGNDSIENQKQLSAAINRKNGRDMADLFAKTIIVRQNLLEEEDDPKNPQAIDEAFEFSQKTGVDTLKKGQDILNMQATIRRFHNTQAMQNIEGGYGENDK